jgi:hypothetical protein
MAPTRALLALLLPLASALYKTISYPLNTRADGNQSLAYDATDCLKQGFVCEERPRNADAPGVPTPVYVQIEMIELTAVDEVSGSFVADFLFHVAWRDDRVQCVPELLADTDGEICQETIGEADWISGSRQFFPRMDSACARCARADARAPRAPAR